MKIKKSKGPRTEPLGKPYFTVKTINRDKLSSIT